jgi:hypothetical protein
MCGIKMNRRAPRRFMSFGEYVSIKRKKISVRPKMVINHIKNDSDTFEMRGVYELLQILRLP